ncbi:MAG: response regulator [Candidatus Promineifilaceae bacterium]
MDEHKQLLIVEEDAGLPTKLSTYFQDRGYQVFTATSGEGALVLVDQGIPDLILLDPKLPGISGYETCLRLRRLPEVQSVPVLFLTNAQENVGPVAGLELGPAGYVAKPFDIHQLSLRVATEIARSHRANGHNPITGLPAGMAVRERLEQMLAGPEWTIVVAGIAGLQRFGDTYGFIAADDVTRAAGLLIANAVRASGASEAVVGHLGPADFAIITGREQVKTLAQHCLVRLRLAVPHFYPAEDWSRLEKESPERLRARVAYFSSDDSNLATLEELNRALAAAT